MELHGFRKWRKKPTCTISGFMSIIALVDGIVIIISLQTEIRPSTASSAGVKKGASQRATGECGGRPQTHGDLRPHFSGSLCFPLSVQGPSGGDNPHPSKAS